MHLFRYRFLIGLIILALLVFSYLVVKPDFSDPIKANVEFEQDIYHIGDEMILRISIKAKNGYKIEIPQITPPEGVELVKEKEKSRKSFLFGYKQYVGILTFTTLDPGEYIFSDITISYFTPDGEKSALELKAPILLVESLLSKEAKDIRDLKPIVKMGSNLTIYYLLGSAVLGIAVFIFFIRKKLIKRQNETEIIPPLPAHVIALKKLAWLKTSDYIEKGDIDGYFTILSQIIREYIENRFGVKAMEMTTQEFLAYAITTMNLDLRHQDLLKDFLHSADLVKYARHFPEYAQIHDAYIRVKTFIEETKINEMEGGEKGV